ncbi:MAG: divergent polysaccharide deacetylase family protein [Eubacterium sp.]|nr:divergent polysaccharide deacetylase family protein [Eubacterium sp.]
MAKKIRIAGILLIILIIIAAFSAMAVVQSKTVSDVEKFEVVKTSSDSVSFSWKKVSSADGYYIYKADEQNTEFEKAATIKDAKTKEYTLKKLEQASKYKFYITAYKGEDDVAESKEHPSVSACTLPEAQKIQNIESPDTGLMKVKWTINSEAQGYQLQYVQGDGSDFSGAKTVNVKDKAKSSYTLKDLKQKKTYSARVRTYISYNDRTLYGKWSDISSVKIQEKITMSSDINTKQPMIALTFDDGPGYNNSSDKILDVLEKYNVRATFFMVGRNAKDHPDNLKRKVALGCELANHTWDHNHYGKNVTASDIKKCSKAIYDACGQYPTAFRSPGGNTTSVIRKECKTENMPLYYWSLDTQDWKSRDANKVYKAVMNNVQDGDIILMHEIYDSTAEAVEKMVPKLLKKGYQLVTCEELVLAKTGKRPVPGTQYVNATSINNTTS